MTKFEMYEAGYRAALNAAAKACLENGGGWPDPEDYAKVILALRDARAGPPTFEPTMTATPGEGK